MIDTNAAWLRRGLRDGLPISLGYFAVSFSLGIAAKNASLTAGQAALASMLMNASAGEFAGFTLIAAGAGYLEVALMILIANARYLLMSCALSQKLRPEEPLWKRLIVGFYLTDEIFGISALKPGKLNCYYPFGAALVAAPGWALGTYLGAFMGSVLPLQAVSALSVTLYGMFLAVVVPPARKNRLLAALIVLSMAASWAVNALPAFSFITAGMKIILLTVLLSGAAAYFFPLREAQDA